MTQRKIQNHIEQIRKDIEMIGTKWEEISEIRNRRIEVVGYFYVIVDFIFGDNFRVMMMR